MGLGTGAAIPERLVLILGGRVCGDDVLGKSHNVCCFDTRLFVDSGGCSAAGVGKLIVDGRGPGGGVENRLLDAPPIPTNVGRCGCVIGVSGATLGPLDID